MLRCKCRQMFTIKRIYTFSVCYNGLDGGGIYLQLDFCFIEFIFILF